MATLTEQDFRIQADHALEHEDRLADHPEERELLGEQGRQKVLETFSEARMLDQIEAILREVICGGPISGNGHYAAAHT